MARPKRIPGEKTACERIEGALYELLEEHDLKSITIKQIVQRAQVNHNTFYYHYDNIEDLIAHMANSIAPKELMAQTLRGLLSGTAGPSDPPLPSDTEQRYRRIRLLAKGGADLRTLGMGVLKDAWLRAMDLRESELNDHDWAKMEFVCGGIVSLLTSEKTPTFAAYSQCIRSGIFDVIVQLATSIKQEHDADGEFRGA